MRCPSPPQVLEEDTGGSQLNSSLSPLPLGWSSWQPEARYEGGGVRVAATEVHPPLCDNTVTHTSNKDNNTRWKRGTCLSLSSAASWRYHGSRSSSSFVGFHGIRHRCKTGPRRGGGAEQQAASMFQQTRRWRTPKNPGDTRGTAVLPHIPPPPGQRPPQESMDAPRGTWWRVWTFQQQT